MLKNCIVPAQYCSLTNKTCGEIVCQSDTSYTIICKYCNLKVFEFNEFLQHFHNTHWNDIKSNQLNKSEDNFPVHTEDEGLIKNEVYEEEEILNEEFNFDIPEDDDLDTWSPENVGEQMNEEGDTSDMEETIAILKKKLKSREKRDRQFKCPFCKRLFTNKHYYNTHVQKHQTFQFKCDKCCKSFVSETQLSQHQDRHNGYPCLICNKIFEKYDSLRFHKETHIKTKNFICDFKDCTKAFPTQRRLNSHKRLHFLEAKLVCEICGSRQCNKKALTDHIRTHTGEKPFACVLCDRRFTSKSLLAEHKACHETERKHVCDVCGKSFNRPKALYHHKHLHLGVKKFVCKICGAAYAQAAGLSAHMRKHKENVTVTLQAISYK